MNLVLISLDTCRADRLGCYGYPKTTSPSIDALAAQGARFQWCFSASNCTQPGYTTIFSGVHPVGHRVVIQGGKTPPKEGITFLAEILKANGYKNASVSSLVDMPPFDDRGSNWARRGYDVWRFKGVEKYEQLQRGMKAVAERVLEQAFDYLDQVRDGKFFLFVHFWDPHTIYSPPEKYDVFYDGTDPRDPANTTLRAVMKTAWGRFFMSKWKDVDPRYDSITDAQRIVSLYDGEVYHVDDHVGMFMDRLKDLGLADDTIVAITADHGETLDETNNLWRGQEAHFGHVGLTDPNIHVPLILWNPTLIPQGKTIDALVHHMDIMPTILELLGIQPPGGIDGQTLTPLMRGERETVRDALHIPEHGLQVRRAIRTKEWKLIWREEHVVGDPLAWLYNLKDDPEEELNLADFAPDKVRELRALMLDRTQELLKKYGHDDPLYTQSIYDGLASQLIPLTRKLAQ